MSTNMKPSSSRKDTQNPPEITFLDKMKLWLKEPVINFCATWGIFAVFALLLILLFKSNGTDVMDVIEKLKKDNNLK